MSSASQIEISERPHDKTNKMNIWARTWDFGTYHIFVNASNKRPFWHILQARGLYFGLSLHLHPYFMYAIVEGFVWAYAQTRLHLPLHKSSFLIGQVPIEKYGLKTLFLLFNI